MLRENGHMVDFCDLLGALPGNDAALVSTGAEVEGFQESRVLSKQNTASSTKS